MKKNNFVFGVLSLASFLLIGWGFSEVYAQGASTNYKIDESYIGPGGNLQSTSSGYSLDPGQQSVGNSGGAGEGQSTNYQTQSGHTTTSDPRLACRVNSGALNFGNLSTGVTVGGTVNFSVLNYTAYSYSVALVGNSPSNGSHNLNSLSSNSLSIIGTEQFGINLRDNTTPDIGADAVQVIAIMARQRQIALRVPIRLEVVAGRR